MTYFTLVDMSYCLISFKFRNMSMVILFAVCQSVNFSDMICDVPELKGDNYKIWKERTLLHLGCKDIDYAIRKDEPPPEDTVLYEKWERSNRLSIMFIKTKISDGIRGSLEHYDNVRDLLKAIDDQFVSSDRALVI